MRFLALSRSIPKLASYALLILGVTLIGLGIAFPQKGLSNRISLFTKEGTALLTLRSNEELKRALVDVGEEQWHICSVQAEHIGEAVAEITLTAPKGTPFLTFIRDGKQAEYLLAIEKSGKVSLNSLDFLQIKERKEKQERIQVASSLYAKVEPLWSLAKTALYAGVFCASLGILIFCLKLRRSDVSEI